MKLSIEVRRDGELLGWYLTEIIPDLGLSTMFQSSTGDYYAYGSVNSPLSNDPILCIETNDDNEQAMLLNENFVAADARQRTTELMQLVVDEQDRHLPPAEAISSDDGSEVRYVRDVYTDQDILGVLAHARRSLATRLEGADSGYDRVINHLIKATNYLEHCVSQKGAVA
jgi:hypothetical protein